MTYTEIKRIKGKKYYYRVASIREGKKVMKRRKYIGVNLKKQELRKAEKRIDKEFLLPETILTKAELKFLNEIKKKYAKEPKITLENRYEAFVSLFTYDSTTIEGNTLTLQETTRLLFEGVSPSKPLREIHEVLNHKRAFDFVLNYKKDITKEFICEVHRIVVTNTLRQELVQQIGRYRNVQVYIRGVSWFPPKPADVHKKMASLLSWYTKNKKKLHPILLASFFHTEFEKIHPFVDGNGRVGRLLMNFILHKSKYPMINIPNKTRERYYDALEGAQVKGDIRLFVKLLMDILRKNEILF